jgi:hypothetical protein
VFARAQARAQAQGQVQELERQLAAAQRRDTEVGRLLAASYALADRWEAEARFYKSLANTYPALAYEVGNA